LRAVLRQTVMMILSTTMGEYTPLSYLLMISRYLYTLIPE
jgi:hypothetical protein